MQYKTLIILFKISIALIGLLIIYPFLYFTITGGVVLQDDSHSIFYIIRPWVMGLLALFLTVVIAPLFIKNGMNNCANIDQSGKRPYRMAVIVFITGSISSIYFVQFPISLGVLLLGFLVFLGNLFITTIVSGKKDYKSSLFIINLSVSIFILLLLLVVGWFLMNMGPM